MSVSGSSWEYRIELASIDFICSDVSLTLKRIVICDFGAMI